jgi:hypothetical protein
MFVRNGLGVNPRLLSHLIGFRAVGFAHSFALPLLLASRAPLRGTAAPSRFGSARGVPPPDPLSSTFLNKKQGQALKGFQPLLFFRQALCALGFPPAPSPPVRVKPSGGSLSRSLAPRGLPSLRFSSFRLLGSLSRLVSLGSVRSAGRRLRAPPWGKQACFAGQENYRALHKLSRVVQSAKRP